MNAQLQKVTQEVKHIHKVEPSRELINELRAINKKIDGIVAAQARQTETQVNMLENLLELNIKLMKGI